MYYNVYGDVAYYIKKNQKDGTKNIMYKHRKQKQDTQKQNKLVKANNM